MLVYTYFKRLIVHLRARILYGVDIRLGAIVDSRSEFEGSNVVYECARVLNSTIGFGTYISYGSNIQGALVGKFCSIGPNVFFAGGTHPTRRYVSTHPAFFSTRMQSGFTFVKEEKFAEILELSPSGKEIQIGHDVWIGASVTVLPGVKIGDGAIIAAGTIVHKDIDPYVIVAGNPMRIIRKRFHDDVCEMIQATEWWNWSIIKLEGFADQFEDSEVFLNNLKSRTGA